MRNKAITAAGALLSLLPLRAADAQVVCFPCSSYFMFPTGGFVTSATDDIGNHCDDCSTTVILPFKVRIYGLGPFSAVNVSSNGTAQFVTNIVPSTNACLPNPAHDTTIFALWDDLRTDAQPGCAIYQGGVCGIFTALSGTAPNRRFDIEWRAVYAANPAVIAHFEVRLFEGDDDFTIFLGVVNGGSATATVGVQCGNAVAQQFSCNGALPSNTTLRYFCPFPVELTGFSVE